MSLADAQALMDQAFDDEPEEEAPVEATDLEEIPEGTPEDDAEADVAPEVPAIPVRDAQGRFTKAEQEAADAAAAAAAVPDAPPSEPLQVKVRGQAFEIPGATVTRSESAVTISVPPAEYARVQQMLSRGREFETEGQRVMQELRGKVRELEAKASQPTEESIAQRVVAEELAEQYDQLVKSGRLDPHEAEMLSLRMQNRILTERSQVSTTPEAGNPARDEYEVQQIVEHTLETGVGELAARPEFQNLLTPQDIDWVRNLCRKTAGSIFFEASDGDGSNLPTGSIGWQQEIVYEMLQERAALRKEAIEAAKRSQSVARFNKGQQPAPKPVLTQAPRATAPRQPAKAKPTGKAALDEFFSSEWDQDDE